MRSVHCLASELTFLVMRGSQIEHDQPFGDSNMLQIADSVVTIRSGELLIEEL